MLLEVTVQVRLLTKAPLAQRTLERLFLVVDITHMTLQVRRYTERPLTVFALVWLFTSMCTEMAGQIGRPGEHFATELAGISILDFTTSRARRNAVGLGILVVLFLKSWMLVVRS